MQNNTCMFEMFDITDKISLTRFINVNGFVFYHSYISIFVKKYDGDNCSRISFRCHDLSSFCESHLLNNSKFMNPKIYKASVYTTQKHCSCGMIFISSFLFCQWPGHVHTSTLTLLWTRGLSKCFIVLVRYCTKMLKLETLHFLLST